MLIGWYDQSFRFKSTGVSGLVAKIGAASYSIYLLHVFFVFRMARFVNENILYLDNFYLAFAACVICFIPVAVLSWFSYRYYELWWIRFRRPYMESENEGVSLGGMPSGNVKPN